MINITLFLEKSNTYIENYLQSPPYTTTTPNMIPWWRIRSAKQQAPQRKRRETEATNHDSDDEVANTSDSANNSFHNVDTSKSHDSDQHGNDTNEDCKNTTSISTQPSKRNYDTSNNGNSGQSIHQNDIWAIYDYISINSISFLTTETAPLTILVYELFQMKKSFTQWGIKLEKKIVCFFYKKCHVPADYQQQWWGGISGKVQKVLDNKGSSNGGNGNQIWIHT